MKREAHYASRIAQLLSIALAIAGLHYGPIFLLTAVWIWMSARREVKKVRERFALNALEAHDLMVAGPTLDAAETLEDASRLFRRTFQVEFPVMSGTDVVGVLGFKELVDGLEKHGKAALISTVMRHDFNGVDAKMPLEAVLQQMKDSSDPMVMVTRDERYIGVLPRQNLDVRDAAAIPLAGLTGVQLVEEIANVLQGPTVLVIGSVGRFAIPHPVLSRLHFGL